MRDIVSAVMIAVIAGGAGAYVAVNVAERRQGDGVAAAIASLSERVVGLEKALADTRSLLRGAGATVPASAVSAAAAQESEAGASGPTEPAGFAFPMDREAMRGAFARLDEAQDPEVRREAALELLDSRVPPARLQAVRALLDLGDPQGLAAVLDMIEQAGTDRMARGMAAQAVSLLEDAQVYGVDAELYDLLDHDDGAIRLAAARSLEGRGDPGPMKAMVDALARELDSADGGARSRAARELGQTRSPSAVGPLTLALEDPNSEVRMRAARSLGATGDEAAIEQLTDALNDPVAEVRTAASRAIDQIRYPAQTMPEFGRFRGPPPGRPFPQ